MKLLECYLRILATILLMAAPVYAQASRRPPPLSPPSSIVEEESRSLLDAAAEESRNRLIDASRTYRQSLERLMILQNQDVERLQAQVAKNSRLLELGLIARRQIEIGEIDLREAQSRQGETARQLDSIDLLVAEVYASDQLAKSTSHQELPSSVPLIRFVGTSKWAMSDSTRIDAFFRLKFGRPLPISAFGQTETHQRLGFDHREAVDVALHPDTVEGRELITYLQSQGISFIAIREAIPGSATGAHIHIGPPSRRGVATR